MSEFPDAYAAAVDAAAVFDRGGRARLLVRGRAPGQMLAGILTGTIPGPPVRLEPGLFGGRATYHAVLTPKGKMITDLWCLLTGEEEHDGFMLDVPAAGRDGLLAHLRRVLPPRMAAVENITAATSMITLVGPRSAALVARLALGSRVETSRLTALDEGEWRALGATGDDNDDRLRVSRTADVWPDAFDITGSAERVRELATALQVEAVPPGGAAAWTTLRVEAGRPAYGVDMDDTTIPVEAGIHERAIDYGKGCYTGQEVIVRIRDRGHVNRSLQLVHLGDVAPPAPGTELFVSGAGDGDKPAGVVTSAVRSPRYGETIALAYVRRGVDGALATR